MRVGLTCYFYQEVTGDSRSGARLGDFKGQDLPMRPCITFNRTIGKHPIGANLLDYYELSVTNRLNIKSFATLTFGFEPDGAVEWCSGIEVE